MKYAQQEIVLSQEQRRNLNDKVIYLIDSDSADASGITKEDIYNAYTGDGGLHGLNRSEYENYHAYSDAKKEIENGQFFTPPQICQLVIGSLRLGKSDLIADLTFGMGNFFNFLPTESNAYGCEIDPKAFKVAHYLYPEANLELEDIRTYRPEPRFDYVVGNPPFHLRWYTGNGEVLSQLYYCLKAAELLKPLGILALVVPCSFLSDTFSDKSMIQEMEQQFSFLGQVELPASAFSRMGVSSFPTKLQFWQKITEKDGWEPKAYSTEILFTLPALFSPVKEATRIYQSILAQPKEDLEKNKSHIILELARARDADANFVYTTMKLLYQIKVHPAVKDRYMKCYEYLHRFYTQKRPEGMDYKEWEKKRLTEAKVLAYLRSTLKRQNKKPALDVVRLVKQDDQFVYKAYSAKASRQMPPDQKEPIPINQVVLDNTPERFPAFARFLRRRRREYETQSQPF